MGMWGMTMTDGSGTRRQPTSEEREGVFRAVFAQTAVGVAQVISRTGAFVRINRRYAEILGYTVAEMENLTFQAITHAEDLEEDLANMRRLLAGEIHEFALEERYYHKNGSIVWVNLTVSPMWAIGEEPDYHLAIVEDITLRKQTERALRESEGKLREAQRMARLGNWYWDVSSGNVEWSEEVYRIFQLDPKEFTPQIDSIQALSPWPEDHERDKELIQRALASREQGSHEQRFLGPDGSIGYCFSIFQGVYDDDGDLLAIKGTVQDVTEHRRAEQNYQTLFSEMLNGFALHEVIRDEQGRPVDFRYLAVNPAFERLTGLKAKDVAEKTMLEMMPGTENSFIDTLGHVALSGEPASLDRYVPPLDRYYTVTAFQPAPNQLAVIFDDITDRKRAERQREELIARLEAQNAELERFTYTVSHDLKSPLITIKGYIGLLSEALEGVGPESVHGDLERISSAADKMGMLLEDLLELSRIGRLINPPEDVPVAALVDDALTLLRGRLEEMPVEIAVEPDLPVLRGDRTRLLEIFQNLIDNSVKYMGPQPKPRIEIGARRDGNETVYYVRDNGIGIEPRFQEKVFGLFDQLDPKAEGTGIGLALVKRIVEIHGGRIWIESEGKGRGSTFCFVIPNSK